MLEPVLKETARMFKDFTLLLDEKNPNQSVEDFLHDKCPNATAEFQGSTEYDSLNVRQYWVDLSAPDNSPVSWLGLYVYEHRNGLCHVDTARIEVYTDRENPYDVDDVVDWRVMYDIVD